MAESYGASDGNTTKRKGSHLHSSTKASRRRKSTPSFGSTDWMPHIRPHAILTTEQRNSIHFCMVTDDQKAHSFEEAGIAC